LDPLRARFWRRSHRSAFSIQSSDASSPSGWRSATSEGRFPAPSTADGDYECATGYDCSRSTAAGFKACICGSALAELEETEPYQCHLIIAVPADERRNPGWAAKRDGLDREIEAFWKQFEPSISCAGVEVLGTDEVTLADIEPYQRFDADWVSFADDTTVTPMTIDMTE